jgi:hypothetical protein
MQLATMPTGHWCQAENPRMFQDIVERFLLGESVE